MSGILKPQSKVKYALDSDNERDKRATRKERLAKGTRKIALKPDSSRICHASFS